MASDGNLISILSGLTKESLVRFMFQAVNSSATGTGGGNDSCSEVSRMSPGTPMSTSSPISGCTTPGSTTSSSFSSSVSNLSSKSAFIEHVNPSEVEHENSVLGPIAANVERVNAWSASYYKENAKVLSAKKHMYRDFLAWGKARQETNKYGIWMKPDTSTKACALARKNAAADISAMDSFITSYKETESEPFLVRFSIKAKRTIMTEACHQARKFLLPPEVLDAHKEKAKENRAKARLKAKQVMESKGSGKRKRRIKRRLSTSGGSDFSDDDSFDSDPEIAAMEVRHLYVILIFLFYAHIAEKVA